MGVAGGYVGLGRVGVRRVVYHHSGGGGHRHGRHAVGVWVGWIWACGGRLCHRQHVLVVGGRIRTAKRRRLWVLKRGL